MFGLTHSPRHRQRCRRSAAALPFDSLPEWTRGAGAPARRAAPGPARPRGPRAADLVGAQRRLTAGRSAPRPASPTSSGCGCSSGRSRRTPPSPRRGRARGVDPVELMIDLALETDLEQFFVQTIAPFDATRRCVAAMKHPRHGAWRSPTPARTSARSPTARSRRICSRTGCATQEFTLEEAVRMLTLAPARPWGFHDRGLLREGIVADVNVFDPDPGRRPPCRRSSTTSRRASPGLEQAPWVPRHASSPGRSSTATGSTPARCRGGSSGDPWRAGPDPGRTSSAGGGHRGRDPRSCSMCGSCSGWCS